MRKNSTPWWVYLVGFIVVGTGLFNLVKYGRYQPGVYHEPIDHERQANELRQLGEAWQGRVYEPTEEFPQWNNSFYEN